MEELVGSLGRSDDRAEVRSLISLLLTIQRDFYLLDGANILCGTLRKEPQDFPGGAVVKNLPANGGDTGSSPGPGRSHMPRNN